MTAKRMDCELRYQKIKESYGDFTGKSLLDFGCAEGFFMWRFMQDGGKLARGVETNHKQREFISQLAKEKNLMVLADLSIGESFYHLGIYLDLYGHDQASIKTFDKMVKQCITVFVSRSGAPGDGRDKNLRKHIGALKLKHSVIHKGFSGREIIRCDK